MKKRFAALVLAVILVLGVTVTVFASPVRRDIYVIYNNIKIFLDGREFTPRDGDGKAVEPFVFDGVTYIPINALSTLLGKSLDWDDETKTFYIGGRFDPEGVSLHLLKDTNGGSIEEEGEITVRGQQISTFNRWLGSGSRIYILDGKYESLTGQLAAQGTGTAGFGVQVTFTNLDTLEETRFEVGSHEKPLEFSVDLVGVDRLSIRVGLFGVYNSGTATRAVMFDVLLHPIAVWE